MIGELAGPSAASDPTGDLAGGAAAGAGRPSGGGDGRGADRRGQRRGWLLAGGGGERGGDRGGRRPRRAWIPAAVGFVLVAALAGVALSAAAARTHAGPGPVLGPGPVVVDLRIEHSRFTPGVVRVRPGTAITFRVRNDDPIGHELIVGGPEVHARHETGTEAAHPPVPGEVSVPALRTAETTYEVPATGAPSTVEFACHLPGHFAYGMRGELRIVG